MGELVNNVWIDKIAYEYLGPNEMEEVNLLTGRDPFHEVNFIDKSEIESIEELSKYIESKEKIVALIDGKIDYICIRLDN